MNGIHHFFAKIPWTNRRIILARDWMTRYREEDGAGGVKSVNKQLGSTNYTAIEIGDVEHFYVAAFMGTIFPNNPIWFGLMSSASLFWEVVVGPGRLALLKSDLPLAQVWAFVKKSLAFNAGQYTVDVAGLKFGNLYSIYDLIDSLNV